MCPKRRHADQLARDRARHASRPDIHPARRAMAQALPRTSFVSIPMDRTSLAVAPRPSRGVPWLRGAPDVPREQWISNALSRCWGDRFAISSFSASGQTDQIAVVSLLMTTAQDPGTCEPAVIRSLITDVWSVREPNGISRCVTPHRRRLRWPGSSKRLSLRRLGGKDPPSCRWLPPAPIPIHRRSAPWRRSHGGRGPGPRKVAPRSCAAPPTMPSPPNR